MKYSASTHMLSFLVQLTLLCPLFGQQSFAAQQNIAGEILPSMEIVRMQPTTGTDCQECAAQSLQATARQMFEQGYLTEASNQYRAALEIYETLQQPDDAALCMAGIFRCLTATPPGQQLVPTMNKALGYTQHPHDKLVAATLLTSMGNYYHAIQDFSRAETCFQQALPLLRRQQQPTGKALYVTTLSDMATVQARTQRPEEAMASCSKALRIARKNNLTQELPHIHARMATIYLEQGNVHQAYFYLNEAITGDSTAGKLANLSLLYIQKGDLLVLMGQPQMALSCYSESVQIAKTLRIKALQSKAYEKLAETHTLLQHENQAKIYMKLYHQINSAIKAAEE